MDEVTKILTKECDEASGPALSRVGKSIQRHFMAGPRRAAGRGDTASMANLRAIVRREQTKPVRLRQMKRMSSSFAAVGRDRAAVAANVCLAE